MMQRSLKAYRNNLPSRFLYISVPEQRLRLMDAGETLYDVKIASGKNGVGEASGSECTPRGWHRIRAKIGNGSPENTVFVGRRPTGELFSEQLRQAHPDRDWILTRILWLCGQEPGFNRLGNQDTMRRYIYIHGCPDSDPMGIPSSHGCIKMRNSEVIELFNRVECGIPVFIEG
jgi:lipoprotein-anchoring transpeptidase ErfK/SrfK